MQGRKMILNIAVFILVACNIMHVNGDVNLIFVFDKSASISVGSFELSKEVAIKIYEGLVATEENVFASALTFDVEPKVMFTKDEYTTTSDPGVVFAINAITMEPSKEGRRQTNTNKALEMVEEMMDNAFVYIILFYDGVLFPRTPTKRRDVIKMANKIEEQYDADILGVKLKNENGNNRIGANDLKKISSKNPSKNDVFPSDGGNLNEGERIRVKRIIKPNKDASPNEHPWMVLLSEPGIKICGGSIITDCYGLTAAHCFGIPPPLERFTIGVHQRGSKDEDRQEYYLWDKYKGDKEKKFFKYYMHEDANKSTNWMPDLALVRLSHPITFIPNKVGDIHLSNKALKEKLKVQAYRWGLEKTCKTGNPQDILKKRNEDMDECKAVGGQCSETFTNILGKGDSGGPWVSAGMDESGALVDCQVGVSRSCPNDTRSRIMNIDFFINNGWIMKKIKEIEDILKDKEFPKYCNEQVIKTCSPFNPNKTVDLVFVFDMSGSISMQSFNLSKEVVIIIYKELVAKGYSVLVSVVTFHVDPTVQFYMKKYKPGKVPSPDVINDINNITMDPSKDGRQQSNTGKVLNVIKKEMLGNGDRSYAPSFVILFHDGVLFPRSLRKRRDVIKIANTIEKQYHGDILGVKLNNENGFNNIGKKDLKKIASGDPSKNDVFPSAGGNLNAENKDKVAEAIVNRTSEK
ncbi:unnamed protein product [Owenia fusiformis]|uniref:Uncharacterized protein n=1 Tax=Owenia fusiformis TaxID=6347 RepID=A0A8S4P2J0_OWEFU|nr:unnamed protein product [Owenia fusiformis]